MTDPVDIIETLRGIQCSNAACSNLRIAMGMKLAIYEIERLRAERDEARRRLCIWAQDDSHGDGREYAKEQGWDCFKEDGE